MQRCLRMHPYSLNRNSFPVDQPLDICCRVWARRDALGLIVAFRCRLDPHPRHITHTSGFIASRGRRNSYRRIGQMLTVRSAIDDSGRLLLPAHSVSLNGATRTRKRLRLGARRETQSAQCLSSPSMYLGCLRLCFYCNRSPLRAHKRKPCPENRIRRQHAKCHRAHRRTSQHC